MKSYGLPLTNRPPGPSRRILPPAVVVADRGASGSHPENSAAGVRAAVLGGADAVSLDGRIDGDTVVIPGPDRASRPEMAGSAPATLDQLMALVHDQSLRAGRMVAMILMLPDDLRGPDVGRVVEALDRGCLDARGVSLASEDEAVLRRAEERCTLPLLRSTRGARNGLPVEPLTASDLDRVASFASGLIVHPTQVLAPDGRRTDMVTEVHRRWLTLHASTTTARNESSLARALLGAGADGVVTGHPEWVLPPPTPRSYFAW